jgi:hypothetical protein
MRTLVTTGGGPNVCPEAAAIKNPAAIMKRAIKHTN